MSKKGISYSRTTISLDEDLYKAAQDLCRSKGLKFSTYIEMLIESDLNRSKAPLVDLTERYCPAWSEEMEEQCEGLDQPKTLSTLLQLFAIGESGLSKDFLIAAQSKNTYGKKE